MGIKTNPSVAGLEPEVEATVLQRGIGFPYTKKNIRDTGTSSGANTTTTLNDTTKAWVVNQFSADAKCIVKIVSGLGVEQTRFVASNTATALTLSTAWTGTPDATSEYEIVGVAHQVTPSQIGIDLVNLNELTGATGFSGATVALTTNYAADTKFGGAKTLRLEAPGVAVGDSAYADRVYPVTSGALKTGPVLDSRDNIHVVFRGDAADGVSAQNYLSIGLSTNGLGVGNLNYNFLMTTGRARYYSYVHAVNFPDISGGTIEALPKALAQARPRLYNQSTVAPNPNPPKVNIISVKKNVRTPAKLVIIFDDGWTSTLDIAAPYLARFGIRATASIGPDLADKLAAVNRRFSSVATGTTTTFTCEGAIDAGVGQQVILGGFTDANWLRLNDTLHTVTAKPTGSSMTIDVDSSTYGAYTTLTGRSSQYAPPRMLHNLYNGFGWDFVTHNANGFSLMTPTESEAALITQRAYLETYGWVRGKDHHVYVGGGFVDSSGNPVAPILKKLGFKTARLVSGVSPSWNVSPYPYGIPDRYYFPSLNVDFATTEASMIDYLNRQRLSGGIRMMHLHDVFVTGTPTGNNNIGRALFEKFADMWGAMHLAGDIECITISEMQKHADDCTVLTPPADWE